MTTSKKHKEAFILAISHKAWENNGSTCLYSVTLSIPSHNQPALPTTTTTTASASSWCWRCSCHGSEFGCSKSNAAWWGSGCERHSQHHVVHALWAIMSTHRYMWPTTPSGTEAANAVANAHNATAAPSHTVATCTMWLCTWHAM
jgi:hypothetical protein